MYIHPVGRNVDYTRPARNPEEMPDFVVTFYLLAIFPVAFYFIA
jgi:hypothetical protein